MDAQSAHLARDTLKVGEGLAHHQTGDSGGKQEELHEDTRRAHFDEAMCWLEDGLQAVHVLERVREVDGGAAASSVCVRATYILVLHATR